MYVLQEKAGGVGSGGYTGSAGGGRGNPSRPASRPLGAALGLARTVGANSIGTVEPSVLRQWRDTRASRYASLSDAQANGVAEVPAASLSPSSPFLLS